ncbi:MAG TPA: PorP/SprF family type IX secretion system membrane protein [Brumimicrobium sp.]|nr:PorP/SprF family type IX secretion system membrane protein [Brumimicrobium sp.]
MKRYLSFIFVFTILSNLYAQDIHFSQMKFSPLTVNPSNTGLNGKYNAIVNFRSQWNSVSTPFTTLGASFDMNFGAERNKKGFFAAGVNFFHDIAGDLKMTTSNVNLNLAYHIRLNEENTLGLGVQSGYGSRGLGSVDGLYASQYNGDILDPSIVSGEQFGRMNFGFFELGSGLVYQHNSMSQSSFSAEGFKLTAGVSAYHLTKPNYSFLEGGSDDLSMRFVGFVETEFDLNQRWGLMPAAYYQRQGTHQEIYLGTYIKYNIIQASNRTGFVDGLFIAYGPFYRFGDAFVNKLLIDYKGYALGISYDVNLSSLTRSSNGRGGIEFMFRYSFNEERGTRSRIN